MILYNHLLGMPADACFTACETSLSELCSNAEYPKLKCLTIIHTYCIYATLIEYCFSLFTPAIFHGYAFGYLVRLYILSSVFIWFTWYIMVNLQWCIGFSSWFLSYLRPCMNHLHPLLWYPFRLICLNYFVSFVYWRRRPFYIEKEPCSVIVHTQSTKSY